MHEIQEILKHYPPDCRPTCVEPLRSAGGMSGAQFWRLTAPRGKLALRRWPPEHPTPQRLRFLHAVLAHAAARGVSVLPVPMSTRHGQSFVRHGGYLWELAPWMPGKADYLRARSATKLCAAMQTLAKIHIALEDYPIAASGHRGAAVVELSGAPRSITRRLAQLRELSSGGHLELSHAVTEHRWPDLAPLARQLLAALPVALPRAIAQVEPLEHVPLPRQPCLRDIWHDHVLFTGDTVTGIVDFGAVDIDTPACDIARLLGSLVGDDTTGWQSGLGAYSAVRSVSAAEVDAATTLDTSGTLLAGCNWIRWIYIERREFENRDQVIERFRMIVRRSSQPRRS